MRSHACQTLIHQFFDYLQLSLRILEMLAFQHLTMFYDETLRLLILQTDWGGTRAAQAYQRYSRVIVLKLRVFNVLCQDTLWGE